MYVAMLVAQFSYRAPQMRSQPRLRWLGITVLTGNVILFTLQILPSPLKAWAWTREVRDAELAFNWVAFVCSHAVYPRRMRPVSWAFLGAFLIMIVALPLIASAKSRGIVGADGYAGLSLGAVFANLIFGACVIGFQRNAKVAEDR